GSLDDDLAPVVFAAGLESQRHPALVVRNLRSIRSEEPPGAAKSVDGVVQLRSASPCIDGVLVEVCDQPFGVAGVCSGGQDIQQITEFCLALHERVLIGARPST